MTTDSATLTFRVHDPQKLWDSASKEYTGTRAGGSPEDVEKVLGTRENPNLTNCIRELYWSDNDQGPGMTLWELTTVD